MDLDKQDKEKKPVQVTLQTHDIDLVALFQNYYCKTCRLKWISMVVMGSGCWLRKRRINYVHNTQHR